MPCEPVRSQIRPAVAAVNYVALRASVTRNLQHGGAQEKQEAQGRKCHIWHRDPRDFARARRTIVFSSVRRKTRRVLSQFFQIA